MKKYLCCALLLLPALPCFSDGSAVGKVHSVKAASLEVIISAPNAAGILSLGDKLVVKSTSGKDVVMTVSFPMMSVAKCRVSSESRPLLGSIAVGTPVYRSGADEVRLTKYHETWDQQYLNAHKKIRFIEEIPSDQLSGKESYFIVVYDRNGTIVKTTQVKNRIKTVTDHYREDRIIKKEWHDAEKGDVYRIQVFDYYPNGRLRESGDFDVVSNYKKITRYNEAGAELVGSNSETQD